MVTLQQRNIKIKPTIIMTLTINKYNPSKDLEVEVIPFTFKGDKLNRSKVAILDIFFQVVANEIREEEELNCLNC